MQQHALRLHPLALPLRDEPKPVHAALHGHKVGVQDGDEQVEPHKHAHQEEDDVVVPPVPRVVG